MADPDNSRPAIGEVPKRRRRRQQAPVEEVSTPSAASEPMEHRIEAPPLSRWQRWKREALSSLGLSPTFRVYVFVGRREHVRRPAELGFRELAAAHGYVLPIWEKVSFTDTVHGTRMLVDARCSVD